MLHPDEETLVGLALGQDETSGPQTSDELVEHVAGCESCAVTVAAYRETAALVGSLGTTREPWQAPPAAVWDAVQASLDDESEAPPTPVSHLDERRGRRPRSRVAPWALGAAAAGIAIGLVTGRAVWTTEQTPAPPVTTVASTPLDTLDTGKSKGEASVVEANGAVDLSVDTAALDPGDGYLEVWLINEDGKRMVSVGVLDPAEGRATFPISAALIEQGYVVVDISREGFDDKPQHSGDSLVRGTLTT